jgi:succinate dehydrogenase/fumarate reductase flavoprotein subunit
MRQTASHFDDMYDVVVIGYGYAGAAAAITAHDEGASVLVIEKMPQGGGNSRVSGGQCFVAKPGEHVVDALAEYLDRLCLGTTPLEVLRTFAAGTQELPQWIAGLGGSLAVPSTTVLAATYPGAVTGPNFPAAAPDIELFDKRSVTSPEQDAPSLRLWKLLSGNVERRGISVLTETAAADLTTNLEGRVVGVETDSGGARRTVGARRAVVMCCGGFENDPALKLDYTPSRHIRFAGNPGNTGDGIRMAQRVGADLWHMTRTSTFIGYQSDKFETAFCIFFHDPGFIYTDSRGSRFVDETSIELHDFDRVFAQLDYTTLEFPRQPSWGIFDERTRMAGPLTWPTSGYTRDTYHWSLDNSAETDAGWILSADTVAGLAQLTGLDPATLEKTLQVYNQCCRDGGDRQFGRPSQTLRELRPPYHAIRLEPVLLNTQGGAKRDDAARVLDTRGEPIPGLFSAGEFGSIWGHFYPGAGNITETLVFGRISGRNAARHELAQG